MADPKPWEMQWGGAPAPMAPRGFVYTPPPDPTKAAAETRAERSDARAERSDQRAAAADARAQADFDSKNTMVPPPGDNTKTGDEYLATIPASLAGQVKALSEGRRAFPTGAALRSPSVQELIAAATQYDPTLDAANAATRVATRKKFTSGTTRDNITAINTALGHLGTLWQDSQKLNNFSSPMLNAPINAIETHALGDARYTNFDLTRHAVVDELEKAFRGSGGTQAGIDEWKQGINNAQSPDQLRGAMGKAVELLTSRLEALNNAYSEGMGRSSDPLQFLNPHASAVYNALGPGGDGNVPDLPKNFGGTPPILGGGPSGPAGPSTPPAGPPRLAPQPGSLAPSADYSGMVGGPGSSLATADPEHGALKQTFRRAYDPVGAAALSAFVKHGAPFETVSAYAQSHGFNPPSEKDYAAAVGYQKGHPNATPNVEADTYIPTTFGERVASSPAAAAVAGGTAAATAGLSDVAGRTIAGPAWDANRQALALTNPGSDVAGNVVGGAAGLLGGQALLGKVAPGALALAGKAPAVVGDMAYGGLYGANENPNDPLTGLGIGAVAGAGGGVAGRKLTSGLAGVISPSAGPFAPLYEQGARPTIGMKMGANGGLAGKIANLTEQAMQSFPGLGMMVHGARQAVRDKGQVGAFNRSLKELEPFGGAVSAKLPEGVGPGTEAHAHTAAQFDKAYDVARSGMQFVPDSQYMAEASALPTSPSVALLNGQQKQQLTDFINNSVVSRLKANGGALNGDQYKAAASELGGAVSKWGRSDPLLSDALSDYATVFDNAARRNSDPTAVNLLDAADRGYAQFARIQRASELGGAAKDAGTFSPRDYAQSTKQMGGGVRSNAYNRGNALGQDFAKALLATKDTLPTSGTPERLMTGQALAGLGGMEIGAPGALMAHPGALAPFAAYVPGVRDVVSRAIAPNTTRFAGLPPEVAATLDRIGLKIDDLAPFVGKAAVPGSLAYFGSGQ